MHRFQWVVLPPEGAVFPQLQGELLVPLAELLVLLVELLVLLEALLPLLEPVLLRVGFPPVLAVLLPVEGVLDLPGEGLGADVPHVRPLPRLLRAQMPPRQGAREEPVEAVELIS